VSAGLLSGFYILFSILTGEQNAGFYHVADYLVTILQQDGYCH